MLVLYTYNRFTAVIMYHTSIEFELAGDLEPIAFSYVDVPFKGRTRCGRL